MEDEKSKTSKKRMIPGSPTEKGWEETSSESEPESSDANLDANPEETGEDWQLIDLKRGRKKGKGEKKVDKKKRKRAIRMKGAMSRLCLIPR